MSIILSDVLLYSREREFVRGREIIAIADDGIFTYIYDDMYNNIVRPRAGITVRCNSIVITIHKTINDNDIKLLCSRPFYPVLARRHRRFETRTNYTRRRPTASGCRRR